MAYIGKSPDGTGVRSRFYYTQTSGGGTSVSGSSDDGTTLTFSDGAYVDVYLNGVLLVAGTDYNTTTANTIAGLAALANGDVVEVVVYDIFTVADTVSALNGGTFNNNVTVRGATSENTNATLKVEAAGSGNSDADLTLLCDDTQSGRVRFFDGTGEGARIEYSHNAPALTIQTEGSTRLRIDNTGDVKINDGNLVIGTAGHGIDFSATSGTGNSELLSDYEQGSFVPTFTTNSGSAASVGSSVARYCKIGHLVCITVQLTNIDTSGTTSSSQFRVSGLPFTVNQMSSIGCVFTHGVTYENSRTFVTALFSSNDYVGFQVSGSGASDSSLDHSHIASGTGDITFSGFYYTNQ